MNISGPFVHNESGMKEFKSHGRPRLRPAGPMIVTRVSVPVVQTAWVTVMFADLRGYTGLAERLSPAAVFPLLDEFFHVLATATANHGGDIYHMAGDGIMAGFGVNTKHSDGAREALATGLEMLQAFAPISERWRAELSVDSGIGVGLHLGEVAVGSLGPPRRKNTTLVGDTVNVAARLCSRARAGEVLFSCTVAESFANDNTPTLQTSGGIPFLQLPRFELRGRLEPIDIWCVPAAELVTL